MKKSVVQTPPGTMNAGDVQGEWLSGGESRVERGCPAGRSGTRTTPANPALRRGRTESACWASYLQDGFGQGRRSWPGFYSRNLDSVPLDGPGVRSRRWRRPSSSQPAGSRGSALQPKGTDSANNPSESGRGFPPRTPRESTACQLHGYGLGPWTLDKLTGLLAHRAGRRSLCVVSYCICGDLLQLDEKTSTNP